MTLNTDLISETYRLPSRGLPYLKEELPLINGDSVRIRPFVLDDKRYIDVVRKTKSAYQFYTKILERLVVEPKVESWDNLLLTDCMAILFAIKLRSFGPWYDLIWECDWCGKVQQGAFDLQTIAVKEADSKEDFPDGYKWRGLDVKLSSCNLSMHLPTIRDEKSVEDVLKDMAKLKTLQDEEVDSQYVRRSVLIDEIDGKPTSHVTKFNKLMSLTLEDYDLIKDFNRGHDSGLIARAPMECQDPDCKGVTQLGLGLNPDFFRPATYRPPTNTAAGGAGTSAPDVL